MPISTPARLLASVASLALVAASGLAHAQGTTVGTTAAVNPRSTGVAGSGTRMLELGSRIIHRERIETSDSGSVQVLFLDKTTLNIGPGSSLLIDEFVYDPNAGTGTMAVSLAKGALRFVGGNVSHGGAAEVKTPVATIGIRGGVAGIIHRSGETKAILQFGTLTVAGAGGESVVLRRPGFMVTIGRDGVSTPVRVSQAEMESLLAQTRSRPGQTGGRGQAAADMPSGDQAAGHPCASPAQGQTTLDLAAATCRYFNTRLEGEADAIAQQASQQNQEHGVKPITPPPYGYGGGGHQPPPPPYGYGGGGFLHLPGK